VSEAVRPVVPGAEPFSAPGGPHGALVVHGFTGNPSSVRGLAEALAGAGFAVELPLLPGHGTTLDDLMPTRFAHWSGAAEACYLAERVSGPVERITLERSYHVATLDYDADLIVGRAVEFALRVTAGLAP
jgi:alpha-beta hydrolase superfamily lysophospholipase